MNITTIDTRHPITIAFSELCKTEKGCELLISFKSELVDLVIEVAEKFTGFSTVESIKKSLEITLGVLSLALMHEHKASDEDFEILLFKHSLKELARKAISLVKEIGQYPISSDNLFEENKGFRAKEYILHYSLARNDSNGEWVGYSRYQNEFNSFKFNKTMAGLALWLIKKLSGNLFGWKENNKSKHFDTEVYPIPDNIINTFLFRFCCELPTKGRIDLNLNQFVVVRAKYESDPQKWIDNAQKRYESLLVQIPKELQNALLIHNKDWFDRHLKNGPVKIPKGKKDPEDLEALWQYTVKGI